MKNIIRKIIKKANTNQSTVSFIEKSQNIEIQLGRLYGVDTSVYSHANLSPTIMKIAREYLELGVAPSSLVFLIDKLSNGDITENEFEHYAEMSLYIIDLDYLCYKYKPVVHPTNHMKSYPYQASFYGAAIGDIIGSPFEGMTKDHFGVSCSEAFKIGTITDDTILSLATRECLDKEIKYTDRPLSLLDYSITNTYPYDINPFMKSYRDFAVRYSYCGFGAGFSRWVIENREVPYGSIGNGSAMRVAPIADRFEDVDRVIEHAAASASVTHNHIEGVKGAILVAVSGWMGRNGYDKDQIYGYIRSHYSEHILNQYLPKNIWFHDFTMNELQSMIGPTICPFSVLAAAICIHEADSFDCSMKNVLSLRGDIDTIGAIVGAIAGSLYGVPEDYRIRINNEMKKLNIS